MWCGIALTTVVVLAATTVQAEEAVRLLSFMSNKDRGWVVEQPESWQAQRLRDLAACRGNAPALTREGADAWRQAFEARVIQMTKSEAERRLKSFDLNGDGQILGPEALPDEVDLQIARRDYDANYDREVTTAEIEAYAQEMLGEQARYLNGCHDLFALDVDQDGALAPEEIEEIAAIVSAAVRGPQSCVLPKIDYTPDVPRVFAVGKGVQNVDGIPEVEIVSQNDNVIPYVVFSETPVVWRFKADSKRVQVFIVAGEFIAVEGVPSEKVIAVPKSDCTQFRAVESTSPEGYLAAARIGHALGRVRPTYDALVEADRMPSRYARRQ
ncbi:putative cross-wall-targeting lipoprotein signal [Marivita hallyeonensis]|uniref:Putative cross-wall-targeting lipoprotein signal n=2 Tax=Marivita hallyeonensis TaxID=996342 RepID=A0A1M5Y7S5_9RHOB|nr:putative cross-wall-targeting lipoprotein signal [Marivita hallyeonensis]